jgi:4-amino-4-deoxy-L-arabinose transferase-like glycosyltransferase
VTTTLVEDLGPSEAPEGPSAVREPRRRVDRALLLVVLLAAVIRFGFGVAAMDGPVPVGWREAGDQYSYWYYGDQLSHGGGYLSYLDGKATSYYPIGYPATLAAVFWLQDHTPLPDHQPTAVALLHAAMGTATVWFVFLIARAALGRRLALLAALVCALFPNLILNVPTYTLEIAFIFWATAALAVLATHDWATGPPSVRRLLAFGTVLGLSVLTRPFSLSFVVGLVLAMVLAKAGWKRTLRAVGLTLLPVVLLLVPWTVRNLGAMHAFVPISTNLGDTACIDRTMDADGGFRMAEHDGCARFDLPEAERNQENLRKAISFVAHHPTKELELMGLRFGRMLEHDHSGLLEAESVNGRVLDPGPRRIAIDVADWWFWLTMAASAPGLVGLLRRGPRRPERTLVLVAFLALLLLPVELWGNVRFHIPVLPFAAIAAAATPLAFRRRGVSPDPTGKGIEEVVLERPGT